MTEVFRLERGLAMCGLACALCSDAACAGCHSQGCEKNDCDVMQCVRERGLDGCYACADFPCGKDMLKGIRIRAFNRYARGRGKEALLARLEENAAAGIVYHRPGGLAGDYDALPTEREIVRLIQFGMGPNPYILCPEYETRHFTLRLVCPQDARDLLDCYADPAARACFNADGCHSDFAFDTEQEVAQCIAFWQQDYEVDAYIRFAIVERESGRAVGTVEAHERPSDDGGEALGIMRLDIASRFEYAEYLRELIEVSLRHYRLLHTPSVVVKAPPAAKERAAALASLGFAPVDFSDGDGYYRITL